MTSVVHPRHDFIPTIIKDVRFGDNINDQTYIQNEVIRATREEGDFTLGCLKLFRTRTRFIMVLLLLLCLTSIWSNIIAFNFTVICMRHKNSEPNRNLKDESVNALENYSSIKNASHSAYFTPTERTYLTSIVAAAALIANFPLLYLVNKFGVRVIFTILGFISAISTCLLPVAACQNLYFLLATRLFQGVAFAANFIVIGAFTSSWTYYKQNGLFVSVLVAYVQLSPALTMPVSGALCSTSLDWPTVHYMHGILCIILFIIFGFFYRNSPSKHPFVSEHERKKIAVGKTEASKAEIKRIPYKAIFRTWSVWAVWIAAIGNFTCVNMLFLYSPTYLYRALNMEVTKTGFAAALPPLMQFLLKLFAGITSDKIKFLNERSKLWLFNSIAFFGCAFFLLVLSFINASGKNIAVFCLGAAATCLGLTTGGFFKAAPLISKHYSHFVTGNISLGLTITMLIVPSVVSGLAPNNTVSEWRQIFIATAVVLVVTNIFFCVFCSADPAPWTINKTLSTLSEIQDGDAKLTKKIEQL